MEIRLFTEQDAQTLWDLRMLALETDPWSFVESPEELRAISVEEFATRLRADHAENFIVGAFEQQIAARNGWLSIRRVPIKRRHKGWIWGVFVTPAARGRGIARSLMADAINAPNPSPASRCFC